MTAPTILEVNTLPWLAAVSARAGRPCTLAEVPAAEWDALAWPGVDAIWLMGVWRRSPAGAAILRRHPGQRRECDAALPDWCDDDVVGSAYAIRGYQVDGRLGGDAALAFARQELARRGLRLILDFVPNHVAPDHPWTTTHPQWFIRGTEGDLARQPDEFLHCGDAVLACGRDPCFPAWPDVVQCDVFHAGLREALTATLLAVAARCDGIRCDMAMLVMNDVVERTWGGRAVQRATRRPATEFWQDAIAALRHRQPDCWLVAECYGDMEPRLRALGFDACYDKRPYDALCHGDAPALRAWLAAVQGDLAGRLRFIENHDEPRLATACGPRLSAALAATLALPGPRLLHLGQERGWRARLPVTLGRQAEEETDPRVLLLHRRLLSCTARAVFRQGAVMPLAVDGDPALVAWACRHGDAQAVVVVNLGGHRADARLALPGSDLAGRSWILREEVDGVDHQRAGDDLHFPGLFVRVDAGAAQVFTWGG